MNIKDLRDFLALPEVQNLPDDTPVGNLGHMSEFCSLADGVPKVESVSVYGEYWAELESGNRTIPALHRRERRHQAVILPRSHIGTRPD